MNKNLMMTRREMFKTAAVVGGGLLLSKRLHFSNRMKVPAMRMNDLRCGMLVRPMLIRPKHQYAHA